MMMMKHEWDALGTATAAFSHSEGNKVPRDRGQFKAEGQETLTVRYTYLQQYTHIVVGRQAG